MAEAMRDEVAAGSAKPAEEVQKDPARAHTNDAAAPGKEGPGQQPAANFAETQPGTKPPGPDEVRRSAELAPLSEGQTHEKDQGTSLHGGSADLKDEVGPAGTTTEVKETVAPDRQAVSEVHSVKKVSSTADTVPSGNEIEDEVLCYEPFWRATERGASSSQKPEIPRRKKKTVERPSIIVPKEPTIVEKAAEDTDAREIVDSTVAEFQISDKSPNLDTTKRTNSTHFVEKQDRGESLAVKEDVAENTTGEQRPGTDECIVTNRQQSGTLESIAIDSTKDGDRSTRMSVSGHETNAVEAEATTKRDTREITASRPVLTSDTSLSNCTQAGSFELTSGPARTESTDEKPDSDKKSSSDHGGPSEISDQVGEIIRPLSSDSISITLPPETGGRGLESMSEASEATLKVIPLSEELYDTKSTNKAKKVAQTKQTQPSEVNEVSELSTGLQEDATGVLPEASEVRKVSIDSKMESTTTENEASNTKAPTSKNSKNQKSSVESTGSKNAARKATEEAPLPETVRLDGSCRKQEPKKTSEGTAAKDQIQRKQSQQKPTKETKKDSLNKPEVVSETPDVNTGASVNAEVTVGDLHMSKTDTETSTTVAKEAASSEKPTFPKTVSGQKSGSKETKKQPIRKRSATPTAQAVDTRKATVPTTESVAEPSTAATTDHDGSGVSPPSECTEVSSKGAQVDGMNAKVQSQKTTGPQKSNSKNSKKTVPKTGSTSKLESGRQKTEDTESVSSVTIKKDVTKTDSDNAKRNQKRNVTATKLQHEKGKSVAATTKGSGKSQQHAERISNADSNTSVRDNTAEVKTVVENENSNTKLAKTSPGRKLNNKTTKTAAKKSVQPAAGDSQKNIHSSQETSLKTECATGTSAANDENVSSSKTFSDQKKSNTKTKKDKIKPADGVSEAEKETVKATESEKNETVPSGGPIKNENNGIQTVELVTQSSEGDQHGSNEESQKTFKLTPERRNAPLRENKRKTAAKTNEKQSAGTAKTETSRDNSETKETKPTEMQESGAKAESPNRDAQTSDSRPSNQNHTRNRVNLIVNRVELGKEVGMSDCPVAPNETSTEPTVNGESSTVHAAADTTKQNIPTTVAEKVVSKTSPRKNSSSPKQVRKEKASSKKLEEVCKDNEKEPAISSNEISSTNPDHVADTIKTEGIDIESESTVSAAKSVAAKTRISKSPSALKRKSRVANPQLKKSSSLVAISKSKSNSTILVGGAKVPASGDTGLTEAKKVSLKKSESFTSMDNIKGQSKEDKGYARIWSLKQQKICREQEKRQTSPSKGKNTKAEDSVLGLQHPSSKAISSFSKEGKTESNIPAAFEASESALKAVKEREENKQLSAINRDEADGSDKSPRKTKADQNTKGRIQNTGTGDVDRPAKIESKAPQEKSVESADVACISPDGKPGSPRLRRQKLTQPKEEAKATPKTKVPDVGEDTTKTFKDVTEAKPHAGQKEDSIPATGLPKRENSPRKRTDENSVAEAQQKTICVKHETRTNDKNKKLNTVESTQKKPEQLKHETEPTTVTVTLKTGDNNGTANKSAGDTETIGETVECTISASVAKKNEQRNSKPHEQTEQTSKVGEKIATKGPSTMSGDGVKVSTPRKQTAEQKGLKVKAKKREGICVVIEEVSQEQKSKTLEKAEADSHKKQHVGSNQEQLTSVKDDGLPPSSPRKSPKKSLRGVPKTAPAASLTSELPPEINSLEKEETKEGARIAIVEIEENDVTVSVTDKQKSPLPRNDDTAKAVEKASAREINTSPRSKQTTVKKAINPSVRAYENSEDMADVVTQLTSKTDAGSPKRNGGNPSENPRSTSPQRLIAQLRTFMTQASLLNKLDLKTKILDCIGVNQVRDGYKIPATRGKIKTPTPDVADLKKVAAALKVGRKRLEDQTSGKILEKGVEETKKELLLEVGVKSSVAMAEEARNKLMSKARSLRGGQHRDRKSTTGSSCFSSSSDTPRHVLLKERTRKRRGKVRNERKGVPRMKLSDTTTSSRPSQAHGSRRQRWASATPELPARVKQVEPKMLALTRMRPASVEIGRPHSPSPSRRPSSKPLPSAAATIMAVTMKARQIAKVPRHETKGATERRSRSPKSTSKTKRATTKESDKKLHWKPEKRTNDIAIRGLTAASAGYSVEDRTDDLLRDFAPAPNATKRREKSADDYDKTPILSQVHIEEDKPTSPRRVAPEKVKPTWHSSSHSPARTRQSSRSPTCEKSPRLRVLHDEKRPVRTKTTVINSSPAEVPCSVAITKKTSVPAPSVKRATRKGAGTARASIEHVVNIDIRMGSLAKDSRASEDGRGRQGALAAKGSVVTKDSSVGTEEMQVLDVCIRALPAAGDETGVQTLLRAKETSDSAGGDVDDAGRDSSESILALTEVQDSGAGDRVGGYGSDVQGDADEDSGAESDSSSKTWPRATLVMPITKTMAANVPRFSTSSVPEEAARAAAALERSLRLVSRACESRPLECDLRWSAWMSALHAGDPDAAATPFPTALQRGGRRDVDAALAAAVRVPALWLLAGLQAQELGARTVKLLHWLLVRLPAEGPALKPIDVRDLNCPCKPSAAFKVRVCAGSPLDARLRWRSRGLPAFEAWACPPLCQLHSLVCGGATTPVGVLSLTIAGAMRRAQPGYGCGASRLGSRLRCVLKCDVAHHPELVERIGADAVVVRGLDLVRVRELLVFSDPLPAGALAAWAAKAIKKRRLAVAVAAILLTYLLVAAIVWMADLGIVTIGDGPDISLARLLRWSDEPEPPAHQSFSFWA